MLPRTLMLTAIAPLISSASTPANAGQSIHVDVADLRSDRGHVVCFLYNSDVGFPKDQSVSIAKMNGVISGGRSSCDFVSVPAGTYAISVYHDENDNGRLDANFLGIPKEGVGASNDAKAHFGPPKFKDAKFFVEGNPQTLVIHIHYL
jgi:uncharacterized protein (DUF2141 family)